MLAGYLFSFNHHYVNRPRKNGVEYLSKKEGLYGFRLPVTCEVKGCGGTYKYDKAMREYVCDKCGDLAEY